MKRKKKKTTGTTQQQQSLFFFSYLELGLLLYYKALLLSRSPHLRTCVEICEATGYDYTVEPRARGSCVFVLLHGAQVYIYKIGLKATMHNGPCPIQTTAFRKINQHLHFLLLQDNHQCFTSIKKRGESIST